MFQSAAPLPSVLGDLCTKMGHSTACAVGTNFALLLIMRINKAKAAYEYCMVRNKEMATLDYGCKNEGSVKLRVI